MCVEESVHVLFDESNSLVKNDTQEDDFELGLIKKDWLPMQEAGKYPAEGSKFGAVLQERRQVQNQTGGSTVEPDLEQNHPNISETGSRTGLGTSSQTGAETGSTTVSDPVPPSIQARVESISVDPLTPRPWKHHSSHPLDQILSNLNTGV